MTVDDGVEEALLKEKLRALEAFGKFLPDRLLNHARAGETDQRSRLGNVQIPEHGKACGHAAGRRIGKDADIRNARIVQLRQRSRDFRHLHEADDSLLHARPTRRCDDNKRLAPDTSAVDGAGDGLADNGSHGASGEGVLHGADHDRMRTELANGIENGVVQSGRLLRLAQTLLVGLQVGEIERIRRPKPTDDQFVSRIQQQIQSLSRADLEVVLALGADIHVGLKVSLPDRLPASRTLHPQALGADTLLIVTVAAANFELTALAFKPGPKASVIIASRGQFQVQRSSQSRIPSLDHPNWGRTDFKSIKPRP